MKTMVRAGVAAVLLAVGLPLAADHHESAGIQVTAVDPDGPAAAAGIERGDLILSIDGQPVVTANDLIEALVAAEGSEVMLSVKHGSELRDQVVQIEHVWGRPRIGVMIAAAPRPAVELGMSRDDAEASADGPQTWSFRFEGTVDEPGVIVVDVVPDSAAAGAGLQPGDSITAIDGEQVGLDRGDLAAAIGERAPGDNITVDFERAGEAMTATATLGEHPESGAAMLGIRFLPLPFMSDDPREFGFGFGRGGHFAEMRELVDRLMQEHFERIGSDAEPMPEAMPEADAEEHAEEMETESGS